MNKKFDFKAKIVVVGNSGIGKTSLLRAFKNQPLPYKSTPTVGLDMLRIEKSINGKRIELCFWDTAGQENYRTVTKVYFKQADAILYTYSLDDEKSLEALKFWTK